jgi:glutathione S-transferase
MLKLCGFAASNYYNKVKLAMLEKNQPFEEVLAWLGQTDLQASPLGKVPYIITDAGPLCESEVIDEYIEAAYPVAAAAERPLSGCQGARGHHVSGVVPGTDRARTLPGSVLRRQGQRQRQGAPAQAARPVHPGFAKLAKFSPYIAGDTFTLADCAAICHLPLISSCTKIIYGEDLLAGLPAKDYLKAMAERPSVQKVNADRKVNLEQMVARNK